jgi:anti-anti-sigma regulatory factor
MLRITLNITLNNGSDRLELKLEGKLAGAWVRELEECWRKATLNRRSCTLWVDLTGVDYVDTAGRYLLALMHQAGARFLASGCAMLALVEEIETRGAV